MPSRGRARRRPGPARARAPGPAGPSGSRPVRPDEPAAVLGRASARAGPDAGPRAPAAAWGRAPGGPRGPAPAALRAPAPAHARGLEQALGPEPPVPAPGPVRPAGPLGAHSAGGARKSSGSRYACRWPARRTPKCRCGGRDRTAPARADGADPGARRHRLPLLDRLRPTGAGRRRRDRRADRDRQAGIAATPAWRTVPRDGGDHFGALPCADVDSAVLSGRVGVRAVAERREHVAPHGPRPARRRGRGHRQRERARRAAMTARRAMPRP